MLCLIALNTLTPQSAQAIDAPLTEAEGLVTVTQSELGKSVRRTIVGGAQLADRLDLKWERFSDSLRDKQRCDPVTNRVLFDNGFRRDGTRIGNPVLGALCRPEPLLGLDPSATKVVLHKAQEAAIQVLGQDGALLKRKIGQVSDLVGPSFARATAASVSAGDTESEQLTLRQDYNRNLYVQMRTYDQLLGEVAGGSKSARTNAKSLERAWGKQLLETLAPNANRNDFKSVFPKPDLTEEQPYDEGALLDALGAVSVALSKLQRSGIIGHWEISIPEDDFWNVVTIAVDDDISIGGQVLSRERNQFLEGSSVVALVRSAMDDQAKISYTLDTFFIDPTTTRQELYNPTQLLVSLSDLGQ